jgi:hypothetical protein
LIGDGGDQLPRRNALIAGLTSSERVGVAGVDTRDVEQIAGYQRERKVPASLSLNPARSVSVAKPWWL